MKFIHCADIHLDSKINELSVEKRKRRREEILSTFEKLCVYAKTQNVTAVIIAGDMFDNEKITSKTLARVFGAIKNSSPVDFLYLPGNHESNGFLSYEENFPENLKYFKDEWTCYQYGDVSVNGIVISELNSKVVYDTLKLEESITNIVTMHGAVAGYKTTDEAEMISIPLLKDKNIDYLALGHYHSYSSGDIDLRGKYAYSGCLDGRGFDELGDKGFVLVEVENGKLSFEFNPFSSRTLHEARFTVDDEDFFSLREKVVQTLSSELSSDSLVKVVLTGERSPDIDIDAEALNYKLNDIFFYAKVDDKTSLKVSIEDYKDDKSVRGEFVRLVLSSNLAKEQKDAILLKGLSALKGE